MVALVQRVKKLEKQVADRSQTGNLEDMVVYEPSAEELAEAVVILVECGAMREVQGRRLLNPTSGNEDSFINLVTWRIDTP